MPADDETKRALRQEVSELRLREQELVEENRDLRRIYNESGIQPHLPEDLRFLFQLLQPILSGKLSQCFR